VRFEVPILTLRNTTAWDAVWFGKCMSTFQKNLLPQSSVLKMEIVGSSKTLVNFYETVLCQIPENGGVQVLNQILSSECFHFV
jgi:hypothetical protein